MAVTHNPADADLIIWNPDAELTVATESLHHRHKLTPYSGETLHGVVQKTFLRGREIIDVPRGQMLLKKH